MSKMSKSNRRLFITIMITAFIQMAQFALTPGIAKIQSEVFPQISLTTVQTVMMLPSLFSVAFSLISAAVIHKGWISKKASVVIGIALLAGTGLISIVLHTQIWHLILFSVLIGSGMGCFISTSASIMFDSFNEEERRMSVGVQTSVLNLGGIFISAVGGYLASIFWYGGYTILLIAAPIVVICLLNIPNDKKINREAAVQEAPKAKTKIPADTFYYAAITFVFLLVFAVCSTNISSHIKAAGLGDTATSGIATAAQMAGGVFAGLIFNRLSAKLKDFMMPLAFLVVFVGYMIISTGTNSLAVVLVGIFIAGMAISIIIPQSLFSVSNRVDASNSATSTAIVNCVFPGLGGFLSPIVFTNLTTALGGDSTIYRYKFVAIVALVCTVILVFTTWYRNRRGAASAPVPQTTK